MKLQFFSFYERVILNNPRASLLLMLLLVAGLSTYIPSFKLDASADSLVLEGDQALQYSRQISQRYASEEFLLVTYKPQKELLSDESLHSLDQLRAELSVLEGVSSITSILDVPLLESPLVTLSDIAGGGELRTLRIADIDREMVLAELTTSPIYRDLIMSGDGKTTAVQINLANDEKLESLFASRELLREQARLAGFSQHDALATAELDYGDYAAQVNQRREQLVATVRAIIERYRSDAQMFLGGVPMIAADMVSFVKNDLVVFGAGIVSFMILVLGLIFRRVVWVVLPLISCVVSTAFMLGLITWLDWRMTVISSNFVALLLIITLSITIHLLVRYRELLAENPQMDQFQLVRQTTYLMIKPCIYTALTTIVAFASLVVSGIRPVIDFGWMMTVGVTAALIIVFIIMPSMLLLLKKPADTTVRSDSPSTTLRFAAVAEHHGNLILWAAALLTAISVYGISRLEVENRFIDYFSESTEIYRGMEIIDAHLGGTIPLEIIIDPDPEPEPKPLTDSVSAGLAMNSLPEKVDESTVLADFDDGFADDFDDQFSDGFDDDFADDFASDGGSAPLSYWFNRNGLDRIEQVHDYIDSLEQTGKVMSLATPYKVLQRLTNDIDDIQLALMQTSLPIEIDEILIAPYLDEEIDQIRITARVMETSRNLRRDDLLQEIELHLVEELGFAPEQIHLTGMLVLYNNMLQSLYRSQILTIGAVFIAIVLMFLVLFQSFYLALIAIAPNLLAAAIVLGGMGLMGIPLDIMTVTIAAISVGIAVDNTIHYVHRFKTEFAQDHNYIATMYRCHGSIGKAMFYTSITVIIGFSILALSNFTPSIYFGLLTGTAMFAALLGALLLLPRLLVTFKPLGPNVELSQNNELASPAI